MERPLCFIDANINSEDFLMRARDSFHCLAQQRHSVRRDTDSTFLPSLQQIWKQKNQNPLHGPLLQTHLFSCATPPQRTATPDAQQCCRKALC